MTRCAGEPLILPEGIKDEYDTFRNCFLMLRSLFRRLLFFDGRQPHSSQSDAS